MKKIIFKSTFFLFMILSLFLILGSCKDTLGGEQCHNCWGTGKCHICDGTGVFYGSPCTSCKPPGSGKCPSCNGTGKL